MDPHITIRSTEFVHGPRGGRVPRRIRRADPVAARPMIGRSTAAAAGAVALVGSVIATAVTLVIG